MVYTISLGKRLGCILFAWENEGKERVYTIGPERIYTIEVPDKKEKEAFHGAGVYFLGGDINWWAVFDRNFPVSPSIIEKIGNMKPPTKKVGVFMLPSFFFFVLSAFF